MKCQMTENNHETVSSAPTPSNRSDTNCSDTNLQVLEPSSFTQLSELTLALREFAHERDWEQFHTPKNLAMALAGEAGELVAEFQWLTEAQSQHLTAAQRHAVSGEMADVLMYLVRLADVADIDLLAATARKLESNRQRYPIATARGSAAKARPLD